MSCVLCKRYCDVFNVNTFYGNDNRTAKDDIIEILGNDSESYLCPTDCVCNICMHTLKHVAKLQWKLREIIVNENESLPTNLGKIWKLFADTDDDGDSDRTPDVLVPNFENQPEIRARKRSLSKCRLHGFWFAVTCEVDTKKCVSLVLNILGRSSGVGPSDFSESSEIIEAFDRKRWKGMGEHGTSVGRDKEKGTKSLSRHFYCMEEDCPLYFEDLDVLNCHKIIHHNILALHFCDECNEKYTTAEHLTLHKKVHSVGPFWCIMCSAELKNQEALQEHLKEHANYSVPCRYCDKSFLNETLFKSHILKAHPKKKTVFSRKNIIMDRVDTFEVNELVEKRCEKSRYKVFVSPHTDMECHFNEQDFVELKKSVESEIVESEPEDASSGVS